MPDHAKDRAIDGLARRQHGAFHLRQAVSKGFTRAERRSRLGSGRWVRLLDSQVYALPSHPGTWLRQCAAATLSVPASGVSGEAAAALLGFGGFPRAGIEVVTRHGTTHRSPFASVRESGTVGRFVVVEGIRVVSPADCIVHLARSHDRESLGGVLDEACITRRRLLLELRDLFPSIAASRLPGIGELRAVLEERGEGRVPPRSELEHKFRSFLAGVQTPPVVYEADAPWADAGAQRVDAVIHAWRLIVEADGRDWHTRVADFERDRARDAEALAEGYATLRLTWHQLVHRPGWCRNVLVASGAVRSGAPGRLATTSAGSTASPWNPRNRSGSDGCPTTTSAGSSSEGLWRPASVDPAQEVA